MSKVLVTYFSASGVTATLSKRLAPGSTVVQGKRFDKDASAQELKTWAAQWL